MKLFTVHDSASDTFIPPFCMTTERDAIDSFRHVVQNEKQSAYAKFPSDFTLVYLGDFDQQNGSITLLVEKKHLVNASKFVMNVSEAGGNNQVSSIAKRAK